MEMQSHTGQLVEQLLILCRHQAPEDLTVFFIAIQIRWKFRFTFTSILIQRSLQNFVHGTTAVLSWHVQKFVAIWWLATELWQNEVSIEFELRANKSLVKRVHSRNNSQHGHGNYCKHTGMCCVPECLWNVEVMRTYRWCTMWTLHYMWKTSVVLNISSSSGQLTLVLTEYAHRTIWTPWTMRAMPE